MMAISGGISWFKRLLLLLELSVGEGPLLVSVLTKNWFIFSSPSGASFLPVLGISWEKSGEGHEQSPCRFLVKACSFYCTHWVAKATCLLVCNGKPVLIKENNQRAYSYLELRCRKPSERTGKIPDSRLSLALPLPPPALWEVSQEASATCPSLAWVHQQST